ncbi:MAG: 6-hydroxycyclohex-1-ene-1-carbonyl-CoA dehydrogenase [Elusimicrobia bacterium RIFCSPHIGHO2_02_FULL_61_10]|nr:MAG: 6-hydroxycyclohex-1-ene-1-carbonyl-CoA dehydrogenase [Elusimicrobia bacterium RIFCSPHIGHO2_02_FULL_61_10]
MNSPATRIPPITALPKTIKTWRMERPCSKDKDTGRLTEGSIVCAELPMPEAAPGEIVIAIAGCGVCHTDLGYFFAGVPTVNKPPLTLGHEISGTVVGGEPAWIGREVIVPAVLPCRSCWICKTGRGNRCLAQKMPGSSLGVYGGFSSHIVVPALDVCPVPPDHALALAKLAVVADAVTTPYQAALRADLRPGDNVVVVGAAGGVGLYMTQLAKALGAACVVAVDVDKERLQRSLQYGADAALDAKGKSPDDVRKEYGSLLKSRGLPNYGWKIFEVSGSKGGQETALALLGFVGTLVIVGFNMAKVEYGISRLMAFDAQIIGTWGCLPERYPAVLGLVLGGTIQVEPFVELRAMSSIVETFNEVHKTGSPKKRVVLTPDF